jgi:hypothetical protein
LENFKIHHHAKLYYAFSFSSDDVDVDVTTLCDKVCQRLSAGRWFSLDSSTNKTDSHDITQILLKIAINTITYKALHNFVYFANFLREC